MKSIHRFVVALVSLGAVVAAAQAEPVDGAFRSAQSGTWNSTSTWQVYNAKTATWGSASSTPGGTNYVTVREGHVVQVTALHGAAVLVIEDSASASPGPGAVEIHYSSGGSMFRFLEIFAALNMESAQAYPGVIRFTASAAPVLVPRLVAYARITIAGSVEVATSYGGHIEASNNPVTVAPSGVISATSGPLTINGTLEMDGTVRANGPYTITLTGTGPGAGSSGKWELTNNSGKILFNTTNPLTIDSSAGYFLLQAGTLDIDQSLTYYGGLKQTGGNIEVASGKTFIASGRYFGS